MEMYYLLDLVLEKKNLNWEKKTIYDFGVKSNKLKFNTKFDKLFYNLNETYKEFLPQDDIWFSNKRKLGDRWWHHAL